MLEEDLPHTLAAPALVETDAGLTGYGETGATKSNSRSANA